MCQGHATTVDAGQASSCGSDLINQQFLRLSRLPASLPLIGGELCKQCSSVPLSLFSGLTRLPPWWPDSRLPGLTWSEKEENRSRGDGQSSPDMTSVVFGFTPPPPPLHSAPPFILPLRFSKPVAVDLEAGCVCVCVLPLSLRPHLIDAHYMWLLFSCLPKLLVFCLVLKFLLCDQIPYTNIVCSAMKGTNPKFLWHVVERTSSQKVHLPVNTQRDHVVQVFALQKV